MAILHQRLRRGRTSELLVMRFTVAPQESTVAGLTSRMVRKSWAACLIRWLTSFTQLVLRCKHADDPRSRPRVRSNTVVVMSRFADFTCLRLRSAFFWEKCPHVCIKQTSISSSSSLGRVLFEYMIYLHAMPFCLQIVFDGVRHKFQKHNYVPPRP